MHRPLFPAILEKKPYPEGQRTTMTDCKLRAQHCGGCPLLGVDYAAQLKQKEEASRNGNTAKSS